MLSYQLLFIALTFFLVLMFNKRLAQDIRKEEEKYFKAFRSSPYSVILSRLSDGKIIEVNEGFCRVTGYDITEIVGRTTAELNIWWNDEDRQAIIEELARKGIVTEHKLQFRGKAGQKLTGRFSAETITINNEPCLISNVNDITELEQAAEDLRAAQRNWQETFDASHDAICYL
jgi:PAS domain S-box-containing protein